MEFNKELNNDLEYVVTTLRAISTEADDLIRSIEDIKDDVYIDLDFVEDESEIEESIEDACKDVARTCDSLVYTKIENAIDLITDIIVKLQLGKYNLK